MLESIMYLDELGQGCIARLIMGLYYKVDNVEGSFIQYS